MKKAYFEIKAYSREYLCDRMKEGKTHFIEMDAISKNIENIFGMNNELNNLEITLNKENNFEIKQPLEIKYYGYEIVRELSKEEINEIKLNNKKQLKEINKRKKEENSFWERHDQDQLNQWLDLFDNEAKKGPKFYFDKEENLEQYK